MVTPMLRYSGAPKMFAWLANQLSRDNEITLIIIFKSEIMQRLSENIRIIQLNNEHATGGKLKKVFGLVNVERQVPEVVPDEWNDFHGAKVFYFSANETSVGNTLKKIREISPKYIYQNSFFSYDQTIAVLLYQKLYNKSVKIIIAPRGELAAEKLNIKKLKKRLYCGFLKRLGFIKNVIWQGTCPSEVDEIKKYIGTEKTVNNIPNIPCTYGTPDFKIKKEVGTVQLLYIGRIHQIKNIKMAIRVLTSVKSNVIYDIFGPIEDAEYWGECNEEIAKLPPNIRVNYCGYAEHDSVKGIITAHHAMFSPTCGENFGQSIVDSMLNGRPAIISDMTPWSSLMDSEAGYVCGLNNMAGYAAAIDSIAGMGGEAYAGLCERAYKYITEALNVGEILSKYEAQFADDTGVRCGIRK